MRGFANSRLSPEWLEGSRDQSAAKLQTVLRNTQIQWHTHTHIHKYNNINIQIQIHKYKIHIYNDTNTQIQVFRMICYQIANCTINAKYTVLECAVQNVNCAQNIDITMACWFVI